MSSKILYSFWTRLKWLKTTQFLLGKLQTTVVETKVEKWLEPSNKSEITGFYMEKNSKFTVSFSRGLFMRHRLLWFLWCCFWSSHFFNYLFCGRSCCKTSIICISCWSRWFTSTNPKKLTVSPLLRPPLILGNSLLNFCVTGGCWFSLISPFAIFTKSINDCAISFGAF